MPQSCDFRGQALLGKLECVQPTGCREARRRSQQSIRERRWPARAHRNRFPPQRAAAAADLAATFKLPEPPADPARLAGWEREGRRTAYCANPVRLAGRVDQADKRTGAVREAYTTEHEPGGCCSGRAATAGQASACAEIYRRDA